jgi:hypothetical protein
VSQQANQLLRAALVKAPHAVAPRAGDSGARPTQPATRGRASAARGAGPCTHPPGRRIGGVCMACGRKL